MIQTYMDIRTYKPTNLGSGSPQPGGPVGAGGYIYIYIYLPRLSLKYLIKHVVFVVFS